MPFWTHLSHFLDKLWAGAQRIPGALPQTLPGTPRFSGTLSRALRGGLRARRGPKTLVGARVFLKGRCKATKAETGCSALSLLLVRQVTQEEDAFGIQSRPSPASGPLLLNLHGSWVYGAPPLNLHSNVTDKLLGAQGQQQTDGGHSEAFLGGSSVRFISVDLNRERKLNANFFFSSFSGAAGISQQNPAISRQKSLISQVSRDISNFLAPTR